MICERMVLRAELSHDEREIVAHTTELTSESVVIRTDEPLSLGDLVSLRLSFRQLLAPVPLAARVIAREPGSGFGYFPGVTLAFDAPTSEQQEHIAGLMGAYDNERLGERPVCRVLLVEDSALMRDFVKIGTERFVDRRVQVVVDTVDTVARALEMLEAQTYVLALVDLYLPGEVNGDALVRTIRGRGLDQLAVIGFSVGGAAARAAFLEAGADLFLDKPVMMKDLFTTVERLTLLKVRKGLV
ncbi:MAG TPA: response regulator [Kofleriaceae bacterium]|nr:response regulator [Kofleriaceae bacterium]